MTTIREELDEVIEELAELAEDQDAPPGRIEYLNEQRAILEDQLPCPTTTTALT